MRVWVAVGLLACGDDRTTIGLDDVSVLFPPDASQLTLASTGNGGPLLTTDNYAMIAPLSGVDYASWRIVAARIDPCFPDLTNLDRDPSKCLRQLRLVAQPFDDTGALDDGIHLLYEFSPGEFHDLATAWIAVGTPRTHDATTRLGVHPEIADATSPSAVALRALITLHAGPGTLAKMTFVSGQDAGTAWQFGAFHADGDVPGAALVPSEIPTIGTTDPDAGHVQFTRIDNHGGFAITPGSKESDALAPLVDGSGDIAAALQDSLDLDNPTITHVDAADCSGCHIAGRARERAVAAGATLDGLSPFADPDRVFDLTLDLPDAVRVSTAQQRGLGYNGTTPAWNQRVVNDSAAVANALAELLER